MNEKPVEKMTFEQAFTELELIVSTLESETPDLEQSIALYERGQSLSRRCTELLEQAELRVRQLSGEEIGKLNE